MTGVLFGTRRDTVTDGYSPPPGFCYDLLCDDEPIKDDPDLEDYNVERRKGIFVRHLCKMGH